MSRQPFPPQLIYLGLRIVHSLQGLWGLEGHPLEWLRSCAMGCLGLSVTTESCGSRECGAFRYPRSPNCLAESRPATIHDYQSKLDLSMVHFIPMILFELGARHAS
jgi:hypothetical protein